MHVLFRYLSKASCLQNPAMLFHSLSKEGEGGDGEGAGLKDNRMQPCLRGGGGCDCAIITGIDLSGCSRSQVAPPSSPHTLTLLPSQRPSPPQNLVFRPPQSADTALSPPLVWLRNYWQPGMVAHSRKSLHRIRAVMRCRGTVWRGMSLSSNSSFIDASNLLVYPRTEDTHFIIVQTAELQPGSLVFALEMKTSPQ